MDDNQLRSFFSKNINESNVDIYLKLLSIPNPHYKDIINLISTYRINISELSTLDISNPLNIKSFISKYNTPNPDMSSSNTSINGLDILSNKYRMGLFIENCNNIVPKYANIESSVYKILIGNNTNIRSYKDVKDFDTQYKNVLSQLKEYFATTDLELLLPKNDSDIENLIRSNVSLAGSLEIPYGIIIDQSVKLFKFLFNDIDLTDNNIKYTLFRINDRLSKLDFNKSKFNFFLNYKEESKDSLVIINELILKIEANNGVIDSLFINNIIDEILSTNIYEKNLIYNFNKLYVYALFLNNYNASSYSVFLSIMKNITDKIDFLKELIRVNNELSVKYLIVN